MVVPLGWIVALGLLIGLYATPLGPPEVAIAQRSWNSRKLRAYPMCSRNG